MRIDDGRLLQQLLYGEFAFRMYPTKSFNWNYCQTLVKGDRGYSKLEKANFFMDVMASRSLKLGNLSWKVSPSRVRRDIQLIWNFYWNVTLSRQSNAGYVDAFHDTPEGFLFQFAKISVRLSRGYSGRWEFTSHFQGSQEKIPCVT